MKITGKKMNYSKNKIMRPKKSEVENCKIISFKRNNRWSSNYNLIEGLKQLNGWIKIKKLLKMNIKYSKNILCTICLGSSKGIVNKALKKLKVSL